MHQTESEIRVTSALFVGREQELARFQSLLRPDASINIVDLHTNGDGGIGKTQLLRRMQAVCAARSESVFYNPDFIDLYDTDTRSRLGVMRKIAQTLGAEHFPNFGALVEQYHDTIDVSERTELLPKLERVFRDDYAIFAARIQEQHRVIALFFDTYEFIQMTDDEQKRAESTEFSRWVETRLFPKITANTRLIVSGRYPLSDIPRDALTVEEINLARFTLADTKAFWKQCFGLATDQALAEEIGSEALIDILHTLADGRPVLLALFADWLTYTYNPLSPADLVSEIEQRTHAIHTPADVTLEQRQLFEKALIRRVSSLRDPEDDAVTYMAIAYRRMTPEMFAFLTKSEFSREEYREILLERLRPLSFIKYKQGDIILLHDEMRRLVVQHWWDEHDAAHSIRREIAGEIMRYYDQEFLANPHLSEAERETYTSELLEYALLADSKDGLARFCQEFDIALEDGRYDYCNLLLREAETYRRENPHDLPFPEVVEIDLRRIRYSVEVEGKYAEALQRADTILTRYQSNPVWETSAIRGHFLLSKGSIEYGLGQFENAIHSFQEAKDVFYDFGEDIWLNRANNWIGLAFYGQGNFSETAEWWLKGQKGFAELLERKGLNERERRRLIQGVRHVFSNLAFVYNYTGRFDIAIRHAEIALNIVEQLPRNNREIARMRILASEMLAFAGRAIDARHHAYVAERIFEENQIRDRVWQARLKTNLCLLKYRNNEFAYLLEYYRAEEIEEIIHGMDFIRQQDIEQARASVEEAIALLSESPPIKRALSDAYYALGELSMVSPASDHWEKAEESFLNSLKWGQESQFRYRVIDTLESLAALYYFWNGATGITPEEQERNTAKRQRYQAEMARHDPWLYPNLFGKYTITRGDIAFDQALARLRTAHGNLLDPVMDALKEAFTHYVLAVELMKSFNVERFYLTLRVFYNRLNTLLDHIHTLPPAAEATLGRLSELQALWEGKSAEFNAIYTHIQLRLDPERKLADIAQLQAQLPNILRTGDLGLAALLNDCLIGAYRALIAAQPSDDRHREQVIQRLTFQSGLYRTVGDEYQALRCLSAARKEAESIAASNLQQGLAGWIDVCEGALKYRKGEYGKLLEFFLRGELSAARRRFDRQFPGERAEAFRLLKQGEAQLTAAITRWEKHIARISDDAERTRFTELFARHRQNLGETRFRLGELLMLNEEFENRGDQPGALAYLAQAIDDARQSGDAYRHDSALESYVNALYFSDNYDHPAYREQRIAYETQLMNTLHAPGAVAHPSTLGRLRIVQGDAVFSRLFQRQEDPTGGYIYLPVDRPPAIRPLRTMLRYYVEACNFIAQHSPTNFAAAVRVLQRRIQLIADSAVLELMHVGLREVWSDQEHLQAKTDELETLVHFAKIRSMMLEHEHTR